jgi:simple sugar transport system ATP-binding protein
MAGVTAVDARSSTAFDPSAVRSHRPDVSETVAVAAHEVEIADRVRTASFSVRAGESIGLTGLDGAGHVQIAQALAGEVRISSGRLTVGGDSLPNGDIAASIRAGVGTVPEDRHENGLVPTMSVEENATLSVIDRLRSRIGLIDRSTRRRRFDELSATWAIKCQGPTQDVSELSGGNQQKVVLARALASKPKALVLINPTAGVDVTAKESIYRTLMTLQERGTAVVVASSDDDDLAICDRVLVMYKGLICAELQAGYEEWELVAATQGDPTEHPSGGSPKESSAV